MQEWLLWSVVLLNAPKIPPAIGYSVTEESKIILARRGGREALPILFEGSVE